MNGMNVIGGVLVGAGVVAAATIAPGWGACIAFGLITIVVSHIIEINT